MDGESLTSPDELVEELAAGPPAIAKVRYTHQGMIDLIVATPWITQREIAKHFGYSEPWISRVFASDAFQAQLAQRRDEIVNPELKATVEERFKALTILSLEVLHRKLSQPTVSDNVAIRAAELGAKSLGVGGHAPAAPPVSTDDRLERLAGRLISLQAGIRGPALEHQPVLVGGQADET